MSLAIVRRNANCPAAVRRSSGFSLAEALVAMALALIVLAGAARMAKQAFDVTLRVTQRAEMQQNARAAINAIAQDIGMAGTDLPQGGIALPNDQPAHFACDDTQCYVGSNAFLNNHLYYVQPGNAIGSIVAGKATAVITVVYVDDVCDTPAAGATPHCLRDTPLVEVTPSGSQIQVDSGFITILNDPANGLQKGDLLVLMNANGSAVGVTTNVNNDKVEFSAGDPLNINQPSATQGNIAAIANPDGSFPSTNAFRIAVITYYLDDGDPLRPRLMKQVNAHSPIPMAENIESLQFTYDIFDDDTSKEISNSPDANNLPNQIRKVNLVVMARTPNSISGKPGEFQRLTLATSVCPRNLSFHDRYK